MPMSCHYMKDHCSLQLLFTYKCSRMWSKVHFSFPWFACNKRSKKRSHNLIHKMTGHKKQRKESWLPPFYKSLLFQECRETSASGVVSQSCSVFFSSPPRIPSSFSPLFDVLCPDHLHMEGKGDTGGLNPPPEAC